MSKVVKVRNLTIGEGNAKICIPIVGKDKEEVMTQAGEVVAMKPDIIEWRCDVFESVDIEDIEALLIELRKIIKDIPLIFTFRTGREGGEKSIPDKEYVTLNVAVAKMGLADIIDVEAYGKAQIAEKAIEEIHKAGCIVIGSNHHFDKTPDNKEMIKILAKMEKLGADICKLAVMPKGCFDVQRLIDASIEANKKIDAPIITMSMGETGAVTRVCCKLTGSAVTFAAGVNASAPGQISCDIVKELMDLEINRDKNIWLIGFMGTGKTTISRALSRITGMEMVDTDEYIVEKEGMSINDMFDKYGEEYFRDKETEALKDMQKCPGRIISCGGGAVLRKENAEIMKESGTVIWLTATPESVFERVKRGKDRPILNGNMNVEYIEKLMAARKEKYEAAHNVKIPTDKHGLIDTCRDIISALKSS